MAIWVALPLVYHQITIWWLLIRQVGWHTKAKANIQRGNQKKYKDQPREAIRTKNRDQTKVVNLKVVLTRDVT